MEVCTIKELQINEEIKNKELRLIGVDGTQYGVVSNKRALEIAQEAKLDLVMVSPNADPVVCKIMDYGKYRYEIQKKNKEAKKKQKTINVKQIKMTPHIETHDLNVKAKRAAEFLENGDKVKVTVEFRGREMGHTEIGEEVLNSFIEILGEKASIEKPAKLEGRNMNVVLVSNVKK